MQDPEYLGWVSELTGVFNVREGVAIGASPKPLSSTAVLTLKSNASTSDFCLYVSTALFDLVSMKFGFCGQITLAVHL